MPVIAQTIVLLVLSNVFMTFAWYAHLKELSTKSMFYLREPLKLDYLWAGLCLCGAAYFMFRGQA